MNSDFISFKPFEGELKISHKKSHFGLSVSTKELVIHKPHVNYHIRYEHIISILPFDTSGIRPLKISNNQKETMEITYSRWDAGSSMYKCYVSGATMHNRSGIFNLRSMEFIIPIHPDLLEAISQYCGLERIN